MPFRSLKGNRLKFLTDDQVHDLHQAVLEVLWEVGVRVEWRPALDAFSDAGCRVELDTNTVWIPEHVLSRVLESAPSTFTLSQIARSWALAISGSCDSSRALPYSASSDHCAAPELRGSACNNRKPGWPKSA